MSILIIDNYDSFTYNLAALIGVAADTNQEVIVVKNDDPRLLTDYFTPRRLVISPGPGGPKNSKYCLDAVKKWAVKVPTLGVCLGHQIIAESFGASIERARQAIHGETHPVFHDSSSLFKGIPSPFQAMRYHSLAADPKTLGGEISVTAWLNDGTVMAIQHKNRPLYGVQFHPESFLTEFGEQLIQNFLTSSDYED